MCPSRKCRNISLPDEKYVVYISLSVNYLFIPFLVSSKLYKPYDFNIYISLYLIYTRTF